MINLLSSIFANGAVLQRDIPVKIWGNSTPMSAMKIEFTCNSKNSIYETTTSDTGIWEVILPPHQAGGPYNLNVASNTCSVEVSDILFGDVWVCAGQSNMELPMIRVKNAFPDELKEANNTFIRQLSIPIKYNFHGEEDDFLQSQWLTATKDNIEQFSAAGYFFAKKLYEKYNVPIGLLKTAVGGTPISAWMSRRALSDFEDELKLADKCCNDSYIEEVTLADQQRQNEWFKNLNENDAGLLDGWFDENYDDSSWNESELYNVKFEECGSVWFRTKVNIPENLAERLSSIFLGCVVDADYTYVNGKLIGTTGYRYPPREYIIKNLKQGYNTIAVRVIIQHDHGKGGFVPDKPYKLVCDSMEIPLNLKWKYCRAFECAPLQPQTFFNYMPTGLYNAMIAPLHSYPIRGVIWYQGESNTNSPEGYSEAFRLIVEDWREQWGQGNFPFLFVQLANFIPDEPENYNWPLLREEQRKSLGIPNTGMVVAIDAGEYNDLHPLNKKIIGDRLALAAFRLAYSEDIIHSGPMLSKVEVQKDVSGGLKISLKFTSIGRGLAAKGGLPLTGFAVYNGGFFKPVKAYIKEDTVEVLVNLGAVSISYAWENNPDEANLYNSENLPASPFIYHLPVDCV